jgi:uncharacterized integral membrane protein (TIGR00698 family)
VTPSPPLEKLAAAAVILGAVASAHPAVPAAAALSGGVAIALFLGNPLAPRTRALSRRLLPVSVVGLGGAMDLAAVGRAGASGIGYTVATITACMIAGSLLARALGVERRVGLLVSTGTAICGGSAIAAAGPVLGADDREMSVALGTVFVLNAIALAVFPAIGRAIGLGQAAFGLWAALGIHDTSSVVGAALQYGPLALSIATTVKLARALWIVPVTIVLRQLERRRGAEGGRRGGHPPWFILGLVATAGASTFVPALRPAANLVADVARRALVVTLFLVGAGLSRDGLRAVGPRPLAMGVLLWLLMGAGTLGAVVAGLSV